MPRRVPLPQHLLTTPFSTAEGLAAGLTEERLYGKDLARPFRGVRSAGGVFRSVDEQAEAYAQRMPATHVFSHTTAARLWHLPLPRRFDSAEPVHVSSTRRERIRAVGVVGHQPRDGAFRVVRLGRLQVSDAASTWLQLAGILNLDDLVAVGDALVLAPVFVDRRAPANRPYTTSEELRRRVAAFHGAGKRRLVEALTLVREGCESPKETALRLLLGRAGMPEPALNAAIRGTRSPYPPRVDIVYAEWRVLVEYDGEQHRIDSEQFARDRQRSADLRAAGYTLVTVLKGGLMGAGRAQTVGEVRRALVSRGWEG